MLKGFVGQVLCNVDRHKRARSAYWNGVEFESHCDRCGHKIRRVRRKVWRRVRS